MPHAAALPCTSRYASNHVFIWISRLNIRKILKVSRCQDTFNADFSGELTALDVPSVPALLEFGFRLGFGLGKHLLWHDRLLVFVCASTHMTQSADPRGVNGILMLMQTNPGAVRAAASSPQASVRQQASRVLVLLGVTSETERQHVPNRAPAVQATPSA